MNRSTNFNFYLPTNADPMRVSDLTYNFEEIDGKMLSVSQQTLTTAQKNQVLSNIGAVNQNSWDNIGPITTGITWSSKITAVENAKYVRFGNVVVIQLTFTLGTPITDYTEQIFAGFPPALSYMRTWLEVANTTGTSKPARIAIQTNGTITNAYTNGGIGAAQYEGQLIYIATP